MPWIDRRSCVHWSRTKCHWIKLWQLHYLSRNQIYVCFFHSTSTTTERLARVSLKWWWLTRPSRGNNKPTLRAPLSGTAPKTLPDLVTPLKGHSLSPRSCPPTRSASSERFGYRSNSKHWFTTSLLWRKVPESDARSVGTDKTVEAT